jgi:LemA protein
MKRGILIAVGILCFMLIATVAWVAGIYNNLITTKEGITAAWAQVENQLQRRNDLIPNLVNTVKGYAKHEKQIFIQIAEARSKLAGAKTIPEKIAAATALGGALSRLLLIVERYPDLKANESFNKLMDELSGTENRIAVERMRYNVAVREYNLMIKRFPQRFFASLFNFKEATYFEAEEKAKEVPKVEF